MADWVKKRDNRKTKRPAVLTCYVPRPGSERSQILTDDYVLSYRERVVKLLHKWSPGSRKKVEQVHIYRRGHPMFLAAPGVLTQIAPKIRQPFGNILFAHSDSEGGVSSYGPALEAAKRVSGGAKRILKG